MTTSSSPIQTLKAQANKIAAMLKAAERGEKVDARFVEKIEAARATKSAVKVGIVMDDKVITLEMPWETISTTPEWELSKFIVDQMQGAR